MKSILKITVPLIAFVLINWLFIHSKFDKEFINEWELRYYTFYLLLFFAVAVFGVLRIYNSIVVNSRFIIGLNKEIKLLKTDVKTLTNTVDKVDKTQKNLKATTEMTKKSADKMTDSVNKFTNKVDELKNNIKNG